MFKYLNNVPLKAVGLLENEEKQKTWGRVGQTFDSNINSFEHILTVQERERDITITNGRTLTSKLAKQQISSTIINYHRI